MVVQENTVGARRPPAGSIVRTGDVPPGPWKNGAGTTREIAACGAVGSATDLGWRISVADLTRDAAFSRFPGIDRTFLIASGAGVALDVAGAATTLDEWGLITFPGEDEVSVALPQGPATAINLMTGRSCRGVMRVLPVEGGRRLAPSTVAVLVLAGSATTSRGDILQPMDFLLCGVGVEDLHFTDAVAVFIDVHRRP